ncbi:cytochrome c [Devosia yakushimensis]|uniref:Cytochrome c n=1 Tax=Devosia yakushimensis TaxID=470028 RepID=A0ABQ5UGQ6_9HYPH|nr:cytochrome c [Devosia yakushimensis]
MLSVTARGISVKILRIIAIVVVVGVVVFAGLALWLNRTPSSPFDGEVAATAATFPVEETSYVARLADCVACHSLPGQAPFAGGLPMGSPVGIIYATNITPDKTAGIGNYTLAEFDNAVRRGVAKDGHRLYPAMPYPSYAKMSDEDIRKLYDYFMFEVEPVAQPNPQSGIPFPLNQRWPLAFWNAVFAPGGVYRENPEQSAEWNRGAYIVQGAAHCGSCHTERGLAFNEVALDESSSSYLAGAYLDGWYASNLRGNQRAGLGRWSEDDIVQLLKTGRNQHAGVFGSMLEAFNNSTQFFTDEDLRAVAVYLKSLPPTGEDRPYQYDEATSLAFANNDLSAPGAALYLRQCSNCHGVDGRGRGVLQPPLAGTPTVLEDNPASIINILLNGAGRMVVNGVPDSYRMTPFRVLLRDDEIADIATFIRGSWGNDAPPVTAAEVAAMREHTDPSSDEVIVLQMR